MKKLLFALIMLGIILTTIYSCKKDVSDLQSSQSDEIVLKNNDIIKLIKQFETKMQSNLKSGESIDLDSAVWNMEALQNYSYAYPDSSTKDFVIMKSYYTIPINSSNKVLMSDVQTVNQQMEDTLLYQLALFPEEVKCMKFWDVNADSIIGTTAYVSATSGFGLNIIIGTYYGFSDDDDWIWGTPGQEYGDPPAGKCDGTMVGVSDGSDELQWRLNNPALQPFQNIEFYTNLQTEEVNFFNCYYNEPPYLDRVFNKLNQAEYCMEDTELTDFLLAADLIVNDYNDPLNDGGMWGIMILDGEGARPIGKDFVSISIEDLFLMVGGSTFMHNYKITYGIPSYHTPD